MRGASEVQVLGTAAFLPKLLNVKGLLDFRRTTDAICVVLIAVALICTLYNLALLQLTGQGGGPVARLNSAALPFADWLGPLLPTLDGWAALLEQKVSAIKADLAHHVYAVNWSLIGLVAALALVPFVKAALEVWRQPIIMKRVPMRGFNHKRATSQYASHLSRLHAAAAAVAGISIIILFGLENIEAAGLGAVDRPRYGDLEFYRVGVMASIGMALLFWASLWLVFYLRVRFRGLEQVKWRE